MKRTPMELAAMASAAVPGLAPTGVAGSPDDAADFDAAVLVDEAGKQWRVRSPKHVDASMRLETELLVLRAFVPAVRAELPFALPHVAGTVRQGDLCTFVYSHLPGSTRDIDSLVAEGGGLPREVGRAMAAIHSLPQDLVNDADLPSYSANEFRQRKLNELDQAATTGKIPPVLLRRWEHALEDVTLWRFNPSVVHGDLHEDNLLVSNGRISAVTGWTDLRIGDPADDFAWLVAANDPAFTEAVLAAYNAARPETPDPHLIRRAALSAEFALAQWLVRGVGAENQVMIAEAEEMLATLEADIVEQDAAAKAEEAQAATAAKAAQAATAAKAAAVSAEQAAVALREQAAVVLRDQAATGSAPASADRQAPSARASDSVGAQESPISPAGEAAPSRGPVPSKAAAPSRGSGAKPSSVSPGSDRVSVSPLAPDPVSPAPVSPAAASPAPASPEAVPADATGPDARVTVLPSDPPPAAKPGPGPVPAPAAKTSKQGGKNTQAGKKAVRKKSGKSR